MSSKVDIKLVANSISKLYLHAETADVHFAFTSDEEVIKVPAHKNILAITSPVFHAMFFGAMKEGQVVKIVDASSSEFIEFLQFFYLPEITLTMENIEAVARLADKYDMLNYVDECAEFLKNGLTKGNLIRGYQMAISLNNVMLKEFCETEIKKLTSDAFKSDMFAHCDKSVVEAMLKLDGIRVREIDLFSAVIEWAKTYCQAHGLKENDAEILRNRLGDSLYLIRFGTMTTKEIGTIVSNELLNRLFTRDELTDLFCLVTVDGFASKVFKCTSRTVKYTPRTFEWDSTKDLVCEAVRQSSCIIPLKPQQSTWFTTSASVILGEIYFIDIWLDNPGTGISVEPVNASLIHDISILEYDDHLFTNVYNSSKILYTLAFTPSWKTSGWNRSIQLPKPIEIRPERMYEIRLEARTDVTNLRHRTICKPEVKLNTEVTIKFHQHPSKDGYPRTGSVSKLNFNQI